MLQRQQNKGAKDRESGEREELMPGALIELLVTSYVTAEKYL